MSGVGPSRLHVLRAVRDIDDEGEIATVGRIAALVGAHPNGVRRHVEGLVERGLAAVDGVDRARRGRPSVAYRVTPSGHAALAGAAAPISTEYLAMATAFAEYLAAHSGAPEAQARGIGRQWGRALAGAPSPDPDVAPARVVTLLEGLGFSPLSRPEGDIALRTCPLLEAARAAPEVLCEVHLGLVQGASEAYGGPGQGGELRAFAEPGACLLWLPA